MRKRIQKLAMGMFEHEEPVLALSTEKIEIEVLEGTDYQGEFVITSRNQVEVKGLVYSSNPHMEVLTPQFKGEEVRIQFQFHSVGFVEGDIQKGVFTIICNQGEYNLSFVVSISQLYADSSIGKIRSLYDFSRLAQTDIDEASRLFASPRFGSIIEAKDVNSRLLYEGLSGDMHTAECLEEFLVAIKKKERITFEPEKKLFEMPYLEENQKETVSIKKDNWGYLEIAISSDEDFLRSDKEQISSEDFVGSICKVEYFIDASKLHAGKNFGRLIFENAYQREMVEIIVNQKEHATATVNHLEMQRGQKELTELYIEYRLKKIGGALWATKTVGVLNHLIAVGGENDWYTLMKAQAFLVSGQRQEATWILEEYKRRQEDKSIPIYGYYLYLCTLAEREPSYVNRLAKQLEEIYRHHEESHELFWMLLFVKREYCENNAARLRMLEARITESCASPFLYMEAWYIYWQNPYLLNRLSDFEIQVLYWAGKRGALTEDIAIAILNLTGSMRVYHPLFYKVLQFLYAKYEKPQMLSAICSYLVRTGRFSPEYHQWYEWGIEADLRIAGLNEAYLMSHDNQKIQTMPKIVQMYFQYDAAIPYKQKAALLVNIIAGKEKEPSVYHNYRSILEKFTLEQIKEGHIDDNLAIIYSEMLERGMIQKDMVHSLAKILYTHKLTVFGKAAKVIIIHRQLKEVQIVPVIQNVAYFQLYSKDYVIVLEDAAGRKYGAGISYQLERLMNPGQFMRKCLACAPYETVFLLQYFSGREKSTMFMPDDRDYLLQLLRSEKLREDYQAKLYPEIIRFLDRMDETDLTEKYLEQVPVGKCEREARIYLIEEMINYHQYDRAYEYIQEYGAVQLNPAKLVPLCSYEIEECDGEEDDFLINLATYVFLQGKYNTVILEYLAKYYGGTTKSMKKLWQACYAFEIDSFELEERLLVQMLYTKEYVDGVEEIYENYRVHGGLEVIREAYLYYFSYIYLVKQTVVPEQVFPEIMQRIYEDKEVPDVGKLALLSYFAEENVWTEEKLEVAMGLLEEYVDRGMYFGFYRMFPDSVKYRFQFYDKIFLEYRTNPSKRVVLHYRMGAGNENFMSEEMNDVFEGIFVKEFTLFFGEEVEYYITEEDAKGSQAMEINVIANRDVQEYGEKSRYDMINAMLFAEALGEDKQWQELAQQYDRREKINEKLFRMI